MYHAMRRSGWTPTFWNLTCPRFGGTFLKIGTVVKVPYILFPSRLVTWTRVGVRNWNRYVPAGGIAR
jgi:hypothetical protein